MNDDDNEPDTIDTFSRDGRHLGTVTAGGAAEDEDDIFPEDEPPPAAPAPRPQPAPAPAPPPAPTAPTAPKQNPKKVIAAVVAGKRARGFVGGVERGYTSETNDFGGVETISAAVGFASLPQEVERLRQMLKDASEHGSAEAASFVREAQAAVPLTSPVVSRLEARVADLESRAAELAATERAAKEEVRRHLHAGSDPSPAEDAADTACVALDRTHKGLSVLRADLADAVSKHAVSRTAELARAKRDTLAAVDKVVTERLKVLQTRLASLVLGRLPEIVECRAMLAYVAANRG